MPRPYPDARPPSTRRLAQASRHEPGRYFCTSPADSWRFVVCPAAPSAVLPGSEGSCENRTKLGTGEEPIYPGDNVVNFGDAGAHQLSVPSQGVVVVQNDWLEVLRSPHGAGAW